MNCFCLIFTLIWAALTDLNCLLSRYHSYFIPFSFLPHPEPQKQPFYLLSTFLWDKEYAFPEAAHCQGAESTFQKKKTKAWIWQLKFGGALE